MSLIGKDYLYEGRIHRYKLGELSVEALPIISSDVELSDLVI